MDIMSANGQDHLLTFVQVHSVFNNFKHLLRNQPIKARFPVEPPLDEWTKSYSNGPGHMTKMAAMPI